MQSTTLNQEKIAMKTLFGQLIKCEYRLWIDNTLMWDFPNFDSCIVVIKGNTCVLRKFIVNYLMIRKSQPAPILSLIALLMTTFPVGSKLPPCAWALSQSTIMCQHQSGRQVNQAQSEAEPCRDLTFTVRTVHPIDFREEQYGLRLLWKVSWKMGRMWLRKEEEESI